MARSDGGAPSGQERRCLSQRVIDSSVVLPNMVQPADPGDLFLLFLSGAILDRG